jgi:U3 small nucleolar ribonucleoprotein protein IMP3
VGQCKKLVHQLSLLDPSDPYRLLHEQRLLDKLYAVGVINSTSQVSEIENKLSVSAFCRRRIAVVMARLKMCETVSAGVKFVEQGHVRVGPEVITDPAYLVPRFFLTTMDITDGRNLEDFVTWVDSSKIKRNIMKYTDQVLYFGKNKLIFSLMTLIYFKYEIPGS